MITIPSEISLKPGGNRLFNAMYTVSLMIDALTIAQLAIQNSKKLPSKGDRVTLYGSHIPCEVWLPAYTPTYAAYTDAPIEGLCIPFKPIGTTSFDPTHMRKVKSYNKCILGYLELVFLRFYEAHAPWIKNKFGKNTQTRPAIFQFAWALRNAIVHHDGKINFTNPKYPKVNWRNLIYGPEDKGKLVIGTDISAADIIVLMFDISDELDNSGCPVNVSLEGNGS